MGTFRKEDLPPLPEDTCLSSSSPQLPALPPMLFDPLPLQRTTLLSTRSDSNWATAAGLSLPGVLPATVLEIPGNPLQHPQPCLTQATFGTILPSHTVPTFPWGLDLPVEISGNSPAAHPDFSREPSQTGEGYRCSPTYLSTSMYTNRITAMK